MGTIRWTAGWATLFVLGCTSGRTASDSRGDALGRSDTSTSSLATATIVTDVSPLETTDNPDPVSSSEMQTSAEGGSHATTGDTLSPTLDAPSSDLRRDAGSGEESTFNTVTIEDGGVSDGVGDAAPPSPACQPTQGLCDPIGECARTDCAFAETGKVCAYTPEREHPFMCVQSQNFEPFRPCDVDDACAPGSVCASKSAFLEDGTFYGPSRRVCHPTCRVDADCGENEWCAQATDEQNQVIADLRICHRHCDSVADCYVGDGDEEVRCSRMTAGAPLSTSECSRFRPPAAVETTTSEPSGQTTGQSADSAGSAPTLLGLKALMVLATGSSCRVDEECDTAQVCEDNVCRQVCDSSSDCANAECAQGNGVCAPTCEVPPGAACALLPTNCGCEAGQTCQLGSDLEPFCGVPGKSSAMSWCNKSSDCGAGLSCVGNLCRSLCEPSSSPCPEGMGQCIASVSHRDGDIYACGGVCDPVGGKGCGYGAVCLPGIETQHHERALCVAERPGRNPSDQGGQCEADYDCASGLGCDANGTCQAWCRTDDDCAVGDACKPDSGIEGPFSRRLGRNTEESLGLCQPSP